MDILTVSIWVRYLEQCGEVIPFPANGYQGEYVRAIALELHKNVDYEHRRPASLVMEDIPPDELQGGDKEVHIDALIERAKTLLGLDQYRYIHQAGLDSILSDIREDLEEFGIHFDNWFFERKLIESGAIGNALEKLRETGYLYENNGATWFASTQFGDQKDRVVIRENGQYTYFATDIAYHLDKLERGFDRIVNVWGADHHGYVPRITASLKALNKDAAKLDVLLVQFAVLYRGSEKVQMSTRSVYARKTNYQNESARILKNSGFILIIGFPNVN